MTITEYLDSKGYKYTVKGKEAYLEECPFCHHPHSKNRFLVNIETGAYICNRQNECGAKGVLKLDNTSNKPKINTSKLREELDVLSRTQLEYMKGRGIGKETLKKARVLNRRGVFVFPYTDKQGKMVGAKYRTTDKKIWSEKDSEMLLINWDKVETRDVLYICEGEIDMLSLLEIGIENIVSVPNGVANLEWIDKHYNWLTEFETIILIMDNDNAGKEATKNIYSRLKDNKFDVKKIDLLFYKDPNEILQDENGRMKLKNIIENNVVDIEEPDVSYISNIEADVEVETLSFGDRCFNALTGGLRYSEVMIVTGNSGSGKSTFVNNIIANLLDQGLKVYTHQGEFAPSKFKTNLYKIMCRPDHIITYKNDFKDKIYGKIDKEIEHKIDSFIGENLLIHGSRVPTKKELISTMEKVYKRNGVRIFFIDNLMTIQLNNDNKLEEQKQLFIELQKFAKTYNTFVCLVAHPRKNDSDLDDVSQYVISGSSDMINLSNYGIYLQRLKEDKVEELLKNKGYKASVGGVTLKDREFGDIGMKSFWNYEIKTGRFLDYSNQNYCLNRKYKWEEFSDIQKISIDLEELPF